LNNLVKEWISELGESKVRIFFICSCQNSCSLFISFKGHFARIYAEVQLLTSKVSRRAVVTAIEIRYKR